VTKRFSTAGLTTASLALLLGSAIAFAPVISADAAPQPRPRERSAATARAKVADAGTVPATTGSVASPIEEEPACSRPRRRLWVEGEGWVVRRVAVCR
jgi:hypothetical protein